MKLPFLARAFRNMVASQIWVALCALGITNTTSLLLEGYPLNKQWGLLVFLIVLSGYSWYYFRNKNFPLARYIAIPASLLCISLYWHMGTPKLLLVGILLLLSGIYMLPNIKKKAPILMARWLLLTTIWSLFCYFMPPQHTAIHLGSFLFFCTRFLFIGNIGFLFLIKDERPFIDDTWIHFIRNLLMAAQAVTILGLFLLKYHPTSVVFALIYALQIIFYKLQNERSSFYFYSIGIDGLLILESIFVQSLFIYGLGRFPAF